MYNLAALYDPVDKKIILIIAGLFVKMYITAVATFCLEAHQMLSESEEQGVFAAETSLKSSTEQFPQGSLTLLCGHRLTCFFI